MTQPDKPDSRSSPEPAGFPRVEKQRAGSDADPRAFAFEELAGGQRLVLIRHGDQEYRLFLTKAGKLVLNK